MCLNNKIEEKVLYRIMEGSFKWRVHLESCVTIQSHGGLRGGFTDGWPVVLYGLECWVSKKQHA